MSVDILRIDNALTKQENIISDEGLTETGTVYTVTCCQHEESKQTKTYNFAVMLAYNPVLWCERCLLLRTPEIVGYYHDPIYKLPFVQIGGDVDAETYGGTYASIGGSMANISVTVYKADPMAEYDTDNTDIAVSYVEYDLSDLEKVASGHENIASYVGMTLLDFCFASIMLIVSSLVDYGYMVDPSEMVDNWDVVRNWLGVETLPTFGGY